MYHTDRKDDQMRRENGIGRCGLGCCVCIAQNDCDGCNSEKCRYQDGCQNRRCSLEKGYSFCFQCPDTECRKDVLADMRPRAFNEFLRRYGVGRLMDCLERNEAAGLVYHRSEEELYGDYDVPDNVEDIIALILTGRNA